MGKALLSLLLVSSISVFGQQQIYHWAKDVTVSIGIVKLDSLIDSDGKITAHKAYQSIGSGLDVLLRHDSGYVNAFFTARHVVDALLKMNFDTIYIRPSWADSISILDYYGIPVPLKNMEGSNYFFHRDKNIDLGCIIPPLADEAFRKIINNNGNKISAVTIDELGDGRLGDEVLITGYPGNVEQNVRSLYGYNICTLKKGMISWSSNSRNNYLNDYTLLEANGSPGNSGGPVFRFSNVDDQGSLISIHSFLIGILVEAYLEPIFYKDNDVGLKTRAGLNTIIKSRFIKQLFEDVEAKISTRKFAAF